MKSYSYTLKMAVAFACLVMAGCSKRNDDNSGTKPGNDTINTKNPVETAPKVAPDQQPTFAGQTRIGSVKTSTAYKVSIVTSSLNFPWGLAFLPDGRIMVTEKPGKIRIVTQQGVVGSPIDNVPPVVYKDES